MADRRASPSRRRSSGPCNFLKNDRAGAHRVPQQGRRPDRQQDVRMRNDSLMSCAVAALFRERREAHMNRYHTLARALLLAVGALFAGRDRGRAATRAQGGRASEAGEEDCGARVPDRARAEGDRHPQGGERASRRRQVDGVHRGGLLREPEPPRASARLRHQVRGDAAAARQAQGHHARATARRRSSTTTAR